MRSLARHERVNIYIEHRRGARPCSNSSALLASPGGSTLQKLLRREAGTISHWLGVKRTQHFDGFRGVPEKLLSSFSSPQVASQRGRETAIPFNVILRYQSIFNGVSQKRTTS